MQKDAREAQKTNQVVRASFLPLQNAWNQDKLTRQSENLCKEGYLQMSLLCGPEELERKSIPRCPT